MCKRKCHSIPGLSSVDFVRVLAASSTTAPFALNTCPVHHLGFSCNRKSTGKMPLNLKEIIYMYKSVYLSAFLCLLIFFS